MIISLTIIVVSQQSLNPTWLPFQIMSTKTADALSPFFVGVLVFMLEKEYGEKVVRYCWMLLSYFCLFLFFTFLTRTNLIGNTNVVFRLFLFPIVVLLLLNKNSIFSSPLIVNTSSYLSKALFYTNVTVFNLIKIIDTSYNLKINYNSMITFAVIMIIEIIFSFIANRIYYKFKKLN